MVKSGLSFATSVLLCIHLVVGVYTLTTARGRGNGTVCQGYANPERRGDSRLDNVFHNVVGHSNIIDLERSRR